ncbi:branched-chain amino acid ABC transporter permease [Halalkalicoccus sp. NIPERK01]|uniref:branched-chain amino acid ABC transporter permease n=1 Tax=Halalkalicoccus sp. NIPERK01 TaxID=3053469 RepID=UPI00256EF86A|nr:branched-chain amino acid ABC transporter permease [Halalkalicoccus sp. NIPERK01]MDL5361001.1 branched-chain amino acid ABC transporter permease [Halalkalicoccus sp. NIPERK01]
MSTQDESTGSRIGAFGREAVRNGWTRERFVLLGLLGLVVVSFGPPFQVYLFTEFLIIALFALAFNLLYGYTGLLSFGHALFYAGGSYGFAIVLRDAGPSIVDAVGSGLAPLVTFAVGGVVGVLVVVLLAVPVGWLSVRLEEIYFALITLAFGMLGYSVIIQDPGGLTNGTDGVIVLLGIAEVAGAEVMLGDRRTYYYLTATVVIASIYAIWRVVHSPFGTICKSIRESPDRAAALGVDVTRHRWMTFVISAAFVAVAGVLTAGLSSVASPYHSHWTTSAIPVVATVIGGATYFAGPVVGAFVYLYVRWGISRYPALEAYWEFFFGVMLIVVVLYFKQGAAGGLVLVHAWLLEARSEYERGGAGAVATFARESIAARLRAARERVTSSGDAPEGGTR